MVNILYGVSGPLQLKELRLCSLDCSYRIKHRDVLYIFTIWLFFELNNEPFRLSRQADKIYRHTLTAWPNPADNKLPVASGVSIRV